MLRAVTVPIASPLSLSWKELDIALGLLWRETTRASNWILTELYARDIRRGAQDEKMPAMKAQYLYPELRPLFPNLPPSSVSSLEHAMTKKYRAARYDVLWTHKASLPTVRYPAPLPIPSQVWSLRIEDDQVLVSLRFTEKRVEFRLRGGPRYRRQRRMLQQIAAGTAFPGEAAIYRGSDEIFLKMVAWLPRPTPSTKPASGTLKVRTSKDSLLVAANEKDDALWTYNADHLKRWQAEHATRLFRLAQDQKYEQRPVPSFADRREHYAKKYHHRMDTACHQIAAQLANYAQRRHFAAVAYDDSERGFLPQFPYFRLQALIQEKLDEKQIEFVLAATEVQETIQQPETK